MVITDIEDFLEYFERVRSRTRRVIRRTPADRWEWRPAAGRFSIGDLTRHIGASERWMWAENVQGLPSRYPGHDPSVAPDHGNPLAYLDAMHAASMGIFAGLTPGQLARKCPTPGGIEITTWKWLRSMTEHEIHHRGQVYVLLGLMGVETPPLYGLTEREVFQNSEPVAGEA